ncbi:MAG: hypothetical protein OIN86_13155 [Candidatus Methanoperedens sp.]|nr:hypothetical protein [Candidatus Methanoperedens sp.]CAG0949179.1 hypothetical protein METP1_00087 [Methanosarcinales archaeon]
MTKKSINSENWGNLSRENLEFLDSIIDITYTKTVDEAFELLKDTWISSCISQEEEKSETRNMKNWKK